MIDWFSIVLYLVREYFTHKEMSALPLERLQILGLCSVTTVWEQGGIFMVPNLLWHRTSVYTMSSKSTNLFRRLSWQTMGTECIRKFLIYKYDICWKTNDCTRTILIQRTVNWGYNYHCMYMYPNCACRSIFLFSFKSLPFGY